MYASVYTITEIHQSEFLEGSEFNFDYKIQVNFLK